MDEKWSLKWAIVVWLDELLHRRFGLRLVGALKVEELEHVWCEWPYVMARLRELEAAEEEREAAEESAVQ